MVELQILSKILTTRNNSILTLNGITDDYFISYKDEYNFIKNHIEEYGSVPDRETFLSKFPDFSILEVNEPDKYLIDTFNEEYLYSKAVPILNKLGDILQGNSNDAIEYLLSELPNLQVKSSVIGTDIISQANSRLEQWELMKNNPSEFVITTGFRELDYILGGWHRGEELVTIFARTSQGKSWVLVKSLLEAWRNGYRVGLIEPEMSSEKIGYRFDTLNSNFSNIGLIRGLDVSNYNEYINNLSNEDTPFFVVSPKEFGRKITVQKLRSFVMSNNIDILGVDGISYLTDERRKAGDSRTIQLTNISEDLMDLSIECKIPILIVAQSNRDGASKEEAPELENIRDSDGIAYNSSIVIALKQKEQRLEFNIKKNRNGVVGSKIMYLWDIDSGKFEYVENEEEPIYTDNDAPPENSYRYNDSREVF